MSTFSDLNLEGVEDSGDQLGGFRPLESGAYDATVKVVYMGTAASGARFLGVHLNVDGREYREQIYYTKKTGEPYYVDKKTEAKKKLPGFQTCDELCLMTTGFELKTQPTEEKIVKLYDPDQKAEINQSVQVLTELTGKPVTVGIIKQIVDKTTKDGEGNYVPNGETREENTINKVFHAETKGTATEYSRNLTLGEFYKAWVQQNEGNTINRAKGVPGQAPGRPGQTPTGGVGGPGDGSKPVGSLFKR